MKPTQRDQLLHALAFLQTTLYEVTVNDLVVHLWRNDQKAWGMTGYEQEFPDSHKISSALCGRRGPIRSGHVERPGPGLIRLTIKGQLRVGQRRAVA